MPAKQTTLLLPLWIINTTAQDILQGGAHTNKGTFKTDPSLRAHSAVLRLFVALQEHQNRFQGGSDGGGDGGGAVSPSASALRVPDLQDPVSLIGDLRACWRASSNISDRISNNNNNNKNDHDRGGRKRREDRTDGGNASGAKARALGHLKQAKTLLDQAAKGLPGNASIAGYRAAVEAAESGSVAALKQLAQFVDRNPESVKGRALHARVMEMIIRDARARRRATNQSSRDRELGNTSRPKIDVKDRGEEREGHEEEADERSGNSEEDIDDGLRLVGVARVRALRKWLETDPLEPRASLGLAALHLERSAAVIGVADKGFVVKHLVDQLETHGFARTCPSGGSPSDAAINTTRAATSLWSVLANLLGPLRVRDEPVPLMKAKVVGVQEDAGMSAVTGTSHRHPPSPPRPGSIWDHLYGADPPWAPTDFQQQGEGIILADHGRAGAVFRRERDDDSLTDSREAGMHLDRDGRGSDHDAALGRLPIPHPLLRGIDRELWQDAVLDPGGDPLLAGMTTATLGDGRAVEDRVGWCRCARVWVSCCVLCV